MFKEKTAVITGAASGIGRALALLFARESANIAISDVNDAELQETAKLAKAAGAAGVHTKVLDVANRGAMFAYADEVAAAHKSIDVVINNAGLTVVASFANGALEDFDRVMNVNFNGVVNGSKAFLPHLQQSGGSLVNISSVFGFVGIPTQSAYCASKAAVRGFTESLWIEMANSGVHIACVHPGGIKTNVARNAKVTENLDPSDGDPAEQFEKAARTTPDRAAEVIVNGIRKRKSRILIGPDARVFSAVARLFPVSYKGFLARRAST
jgi:NAD(P)-dependent dehydrogenase (short-subunit alcohol dehydrogenase family)